MAELFQSRLSCVPGFHGAARKMSEVMSEAVRGEK